MKKVTLLLIVCVLLGCIGYAGSEPTTRPAEEILAQEKAVRDVLEEADFPVTMQSVCITDAAPAHTEHLLSRREASVSYPFVKVCGELKSNPIAAFLELADQELYRFLYETEEWMWVYLEWIEDYSLLCQLEERPSFDTLKVYRNHRDEAELLRDVLQMSALLEDGIDMEEQILKATNDLRNLGFKKSKEEQVSYAYYVYSNDMFANVLCFYIHHKDEEEQISDVEFQLLTLSYNVYRENVTYDDNWFHIEFANEAQLLSLVDAVEMNLTGTSLFHQQATMHFSAMNGGGVDIPAQYTIGDYHITIQRQCYDTSALGSPRYGDGYETAVLTTYRIQKKN